MEIAIVETPNAAVECRDSVFIRYTPESNGIGPVLSVTQRETPPTDAEMNRWAGIFKQFHPRIAGDALITDGGSVNGYHIRRISMPAEYPLPKKAIKQEEETNEPEETMG